MDDEARFEDRRPITNGRVDMNSHAELQIQKPNLALKRLDILVGEWNLVGIHPLFPSPVPGRSSFEWLEEEALLVWRSSFERPGPPSAISVIGHDDSVETYSLLYFDERGVSRIYTMNLKGNVWKMWRESPGFSQRFTGTFSDDGNIITGHWEKSSDGSNWEQDLDLTFTKVR